MRQMNENEVFFVHLRDHFPYQKGKLEEIELRESPCGGATIAYTFKSNGSNSVLSWAIAHCNQMDHFNKRTGRVKAAGRLKSENYRKSKVVDSEITVNDVINILKEEYYKEKQEFDIDVRQYVY